MGMHRSAHAAAYPIVTRNASFVIAAAHEDAVVEAIVHRIPPLDAGRSHLVVTPNINHLAELQVSADLGAAYRRSSMFLADGWPVARLARRLGVALDQRATGSGVVAALARTPGDGRRLFLIGGTTAASSEAAARVFREAGWIVQAEQAPFGWLDEATNVEALRSEVCDFAPDVVLVGLGSPKQELLSLLLMDAGTTAVFVGVGASIDFLSGTTRRAPAWMQRAGLEWLHRIGTDPARLARRYLFDVLPFLLVARQSVLASASARRAAVAPGRIGV